MPDISGEVDPTVLAALTPSLRLDLLQVWFHVNSVFLLTLHTKSYVTEEDIGNQKQKLKSDAKGKKIHSDNVERNIEMGETWPSSSNQQRLDEM